MQASKQKSGAVENWLKIGIDNSRQVSRLVQSGKAAFTIDLRRVDEGIYYMGTCRRHLTSHLRHDIIETTGEGTSTDSKETYLREFTYIGLPGIFRVGKVQTQGWSVIS